MSKLYLKYKNLKENDKETIYLFKVGAFYLFIDEDAKLISEKLSLKLTRLNNEIYKCGIPINSLDKYTKILDLLNIGYRIIDSDINIGNCLKRIEKLDLNYLSPMKAFQIIEEIKGFISENGTS